MPARYRIDTSRCILFSETHGVVTEVELSRLWRAIGRDPRMKIGCDELHDYTAVTKVEASTDFLRDFTVSFRRYDEGGANEGARIAFVAAADEIFGLSRMTQIIREDSPPEIRVFRDVAAAREWLGLPVEEEGSASAEWVDT